MKYILSTIALCIIALSLYVIWQDIGTYQEESNTNTLNLTQNVAVTGQALANNTLTSVEISAKIPANNPKTKAILALGDSLTAGYGIVLEKSWVYLLEQNLRSNINDNYRVINAGISGDTTGGGLARLKQALEQHKPEIVIIELGGNDGLRGYPVKSIRENLQKIIRTVQASGAKAILAGMQIPPNYGERYTTMFAEIYPQLSEQENVALIPFILDGVALKEAWMQKDGIHPNEQGQDRIAENVLFTLKPLLK